ncbi:transglycosylase [Tengunoibacter tsumagoiensis]|uniref:Transglycosylase n=1 Tax=Tengunoibacter tsumagoiensis TaxID=2014871 RepID=A0A402AAK9_9CHLR|nr:transglycosylase [Tengunoibacter tsumagoiensis]GCE16076.1 hypothetical protein KTT_59350 [Tengunoibacter tsumagoiensis]
MHITVTNLIVWLIIALIGGVIGEVIARRRARDGIVGATIVGFIGMFLVVGLLGIHIAGDIWKADIPIFTSLIVAALSVALWSGLFYRHVYRRGYERYYRRGTYVRRPRRRFRLF